MNFKEAMSEMIDGKECSKRTCHYKFDGTTLKYRYGSNNWDVNRNPMSDHNSGTWTLVKRSIIIDGKTIELSEESYQELKRSLT